MVQAGILSGRRPPRITFIVRPVKRRIENEQELRIAIAASVDASMAEILWVDAAGRT